MGQLLEELDRGFELINFVLQAQIVLSFILGVAHRILLWFFHFLVQVVAATWVHLVVLA